MPFGVDGVERAMQPSVGVERYGLDTQTVDVIPVERMGEPVEDF